MEQLCKKDLTSILINVMYVKLLLTVPRNMVIAAGNAAWILSVYATVIMLLIYRFVNEFDVWNMNLIQNKVLKIIFGTVTSAILLLSMSSVAKIYPETVKIILLKNTPIEIIFIITGIAAVIGVFISIEPIGRITTLFQPVAAVIMILCVLLLIPHMELSNITPILGNGIKSIAVDGLTSLSVFSDIILLYILPCEKQHKKKAGYTAIIITGIIMTVTLFCYCLLFPDNISSDFVLPVYHMVRLIQVGDFFGRFEAFFEFVWSISILLYFSSYLYALSIVWKNAFDIKYSKPLIAPFIIILFVFVYNSGSYTDMNKNYVIYSISLIISTTLLPLISAAVKKLEERKYQ